MPHSSRDGNRHVGVPRRRHLGEHKPSDPRTRRGVLQALATGGLIVVAGCTRQLADEASPGGTSPRDGTSRTNTPAAPTKLVPDDGDSRDFFGASVALANDTAVVGAREDEDPTGDGAGAAYVFERETDGWNETAKLSPADGNENASFGASVALWEDTTLVSNAHHHPDVPSTVYVFERTSDRWTETTTLVPAAGEYDDLRAGALEGDTALVAAPTDSRYNGTRAGAVYVFERARDGWTETATLTPADSDTDDYFGGSVALAGDTALVGAPSDEDPWGKYGGAAYLFERGTDGWTEATKLTPTDGEKYDQFGFGVALEDETVCIGARGWKDKSTQIPGEAYIFERANDGWAQMAHLTPGDGTTRDWLGTEVAIVDGLGLINNPSDTTNGKGAGAAYAVEKTDGTWSQAAKLAAPDGDERDHYGLTLALSGRTALIGAPRDEDPNGEEAGAAYIHYL